LKFVDVPQLKYKPPISSQSHPANSTEKPSDKAAFQSLSFSLLFPTSFNCLCHSAALFVDANKQKHEECEANGQSWQRRAFSSSTFSVFSLSV
jgi:hypothetical protein